MEIKILVTIDRRIKPHRLPEIPLFLFCCSQSKLVARRVRNSLTQPTRLLMSTSEQGVVAVNDSPIDDARQEAILKDQQLKAALLQKMGLGDEANTDSTLPLVGRAQVAGLPTD